MKKFTVLVTSASLPTAYGIFKILVYQSKDGQEHVALLGNKPIRENPLVRVHSQCLTGDTFSSKRCDCRQQLHKSMKLINKNGGVIIYLNQEGRGLGLVNKIRAYKLQNQGLDTVEANKALHLPVDSRDYRMAAQILKELGILQVKLLTNNPEKLKQLEKNGVHVTRRIPLEAKPHKLNRDYLLTKKEKLGHILKL